MPSEFYKPLSQILTSGSSVNGRDAFVGPLPLRAKKNNKDSNKSPLNKPDAAQVPQNGKKAAIKPELQLRGQGMGNPANKQKKLKEQTMTPDRTSNSTSPQTTSTPESTTTNTRETMPRTTRSERPRDDRRSNNNNRGNTGGPGSRRNDNPSFTSATYQETKTPFNTYSKGVDSSAFVVDGLEGPVNWGTNLESTCLLRPEILSYDLLSNEIQPKVLVNCCSFGDAFGNASTNNVKFYDTFITLLFNRYQADLLRYTRGVVPSFWTSANFRTAMKTVIKALEYYYTLDSILAFANKGVANFSGNRSLELYSMNYNTANILNSRDTLRKQFQGLWCPPNLAMFIRGFYQYYRTSDKAGQASVFRYVPSSDFVLSQNSVNTITASVLGSITTLVSQMSDSTTLSILGVLANLYPDGIINGMPKSCDDAHFVADMNEMFINDPLICNDLNATNALSVSPISYFDTSNDIPYYSFLNPKEMNGMNFALQMICNTATTIVTGNAWATQTNYFGLRAPLVVGTSPAQCNKFLYDATTSLMVPRNQQNPLLQIGTETHLVITNVSATKFASVPVFGAQRVHFDQYNAPGTYFNIIASKLFGTAI